MTFNFNVEGLFLFENVDDEFDVFVLIYTK